MRKTIIFSDLDGTLLDDSHYSFKDALPAVRLLQTRSIPLVLCSSKTRAEIEYCRLGLHNRHPFVSENGGGIFIPQGYFSAPFEMATVDGYQAIILGSPYAEIRSRFVALREQLGIAVRGFGDMSVEEVARLTGLPVAQATLARQRDFDEPFVFDGTPDERFLRAIEDAGLNWTQGRIFHILGSHDKGRAVRILQSLYAREFGAITSIGLGDGFNDLPLLTAVDQAVLVRHQDGNFDPRVDIPGLLKTDRPGPAGWNDALFRLLVEE